MSPHNDVDRVLEDWLTEGPSHLSDRAIGRINSQLQHTPQRRHAWLPGREHMNRFALALGSAAVIVVAAVLALGLFVNNANPNVGGAASPTPTAASSATPAAATPVVFTSTLYPYSITLPAGWVTTPARAQWDGTSAPIFNDPVVDAFGPVGDVGAFVSVAPTTSSLAAWAADGIATNERWHAVDSGCPNGQTPDSVESITIGGQPGTLVGFKNCFFVNLAFTVVNGYGYRFGFRDPMTMNSPTIMTMLTSVVFH
jgi:hypothetical protein